MFLVDTKVIKKKYNDIYISFYIEGIDNNNEEINIEEYVVNIIYSINGKYLEESKDIRDSISVILIY